MILLRSMLYFPANNVRAAVKAATLLTDAVIFDLEDAVSIDDKESGRILAGSLIKLVKRRGIHTFVRVNDLGTGLTTDDLNSTVTDGLDGVVLPKTEKRSDVAEVNGMLDRVEKKETLASESIKLVPLIESAKGVVNACEIASVSDRIVAVAFGAGDYCRDLGRDISSVSPEEIELLYARSHIVNASRAAGVMAIDTPFLGSLTDREAFLKEIDLAVRLGFKGKQCIHPSQTEPVNKMFSPSPEEVSRARRIVDAFDQAQARKIGVVVVEGKMVDLMTYRQAKYVLETYERTAHRTSARKALSVDLSEIFSASR
jgi:citrate lyase subunit beta/citryl-CoA lyase